MFSFVSSFSLKSNRFWQRSRVSRAVCSVLLPWMLIYVCYLVKQTHFHVFSCTLCPLALKRFFVLCGLTFPIRTEWFCFTQQAHLTNLSSSRKIYITSMREVNGILSFFFFFCCITSPKRIVISLSPEATLACVYYIYYGSCCCKRLLRPLQNAVYCPL